MRICLIGAGNAGTHLGLAIHGAGHEITQVFSRNSHSAERLAKRISSNPITDLTSVHADVDVVLISVTDDALPHVIAHIREQASEVLMVHTAGSVPMTVFNDHPQYGVLWPVQTLSVSREIDMHSVPLAISGNTSEALKVIDGLAMSISGQVCRVDDAQRMFLHLAATFASNFANHMYELAAGITRSQNIPFDILKPLIMETAHKIQTLSPQEAQTGAAVRGDFETMRRHLEMLESNEDVYRLYALISRSIVKEAEESRGSNTS